MRVYLDGVFDLYHRGHLESFKTIKSKEFFNYLKTNDFFDGKICLIIGVVSDKDCESYKRKPIIREEDRVELLRYNSIVDEIIFPCPLIITKEFINKHKIDMVVHGFSNEIDYKNQKDFFKVPIELGIFKRIDYYNKTSTTDIINSIKLR